jgi:hypothetical protein
VVLGCTQGALLCFLFEPVGLGQYSNHPGFLDSKYNIISALSALSAAYLLHRTK